MTLRQSVSPLPPTSDGETLSSRTPEHGYGDHLFLGGDAGTLVASQVAVHPRPTVELLASQCRLHLLVGVKLIPLGVRDGIVVLLEVPIGLSSIFEPVPIVGQHPVDQRDMVVVGNARAIAFERQNAPIRGVIPRQRIADFLDRLHCRWVYGQRRTR